MNLFLLSSGAKRTDFIIPREVLMNVVDLDMDFTPPLVVAAPHDAAFASCAAYFTFKHTRKRLIKKFFWQTSILKYFNK
jgi:hypothetical protein